MKTRNRIEFFDWNIVTPETSKIRKTCLKKHDLSGPKYNDTHVQKYVLDPVQNSVTLSSKNNSRKFFQQYFRSGIHGIHESVRDSQNFVGPGPARSWISQFLFGPGKPLFDLRTYLPLPLFDPHPHFTLIFPLNSSLIHLHPYFTLTLICLHPYFTLTHFLPKSQFYPNCWDQFKIEYFEQ